MGKGHIVRVRDNFTCLRNKTVTATKTFPLRFREQEEGDLLWKIACRD